MNSIIVELNNKVNMRINSDRIGQSYFNALHSICPHLAQLILSTKYDPFYQDKNIPNLLGLIQEIESMKIVERLNRLDEKMKKALNSFFTNKLRTDKQICTL